jgi:hypothetical protein
MTRKKQYIERRTESGACWRSWSDEDGRTPASAILDEETTATEVTPNVATFVQYIEMASTSKRARAARIPAGELIAWLEQKRPFGAAFIAGEPYDHELFARVLRDCGWTKRSKDCVNVTIYRQNGMMHYAMILWEGGSVIIAGLHRDSPPKVNGELVVHEAPWTFERRGK